MKPSLYKIEVCYVDGVSKNTYAFKVEDAERYISDYKHLKKIGAASVRLYIIYVNRGIQYQILRESHLVK